MRTRLLKPSSGQGPWLCAPGARAVSAAVAVTVTAVITVVQV